MVNTYRYHFAGAQQKARTRRAIILGRGLSNKPRKVLIANVRACQIFLCYRQSYRQTFATLAFLGAAKTARLRFGRSQAPGHLLI
jgi:hypothetical protein